MSLVHVMHYRKLKRDELMHHGVAGQKWGVTNGPLYPLNKSSYSEAEKRAMYASDLDYISKRGDVSTKEAAKYMAEAKELYSEAKTVEPQITNDVADAVSNTSAKLYGFENRLKTEKSIGAKLAAEPDSKIRDAVRYTALSKDDDFVDNYFSIKDDLSSKGYTETKCKNYFDLYNQGLVKHKSVQCNFKNSDGYEFEIQFQTPSSQKAKDKKTPLYEESRNKTTSDSRRAVLEKEMVKLAEAVPNPNGIDRIKTHK